MIRHEWGLSTRPDDTKFVYEECVHCGAERFRGYWHNLKRPSRTGEWRKWRAPGPIRKGTTSCPGAKLKAA